MSKTEKTDSKHTLVIPPQRNDIIHDCPELMSLDTIMSFSSFISKNESQMKVLGIRVPSRVLFDD